MSKSIADDQMAALPHGTSMATPPPLPAPATNVGCFTQTITASLGSVAVVLALCGAFIPQPDGSRSLLNWTTVSAWITYAILAWWIEKAGTPMAKSKWLAFVGMLLFSLAFVGAHTKEPPYQPPLPKGPSEEERFQQVLERAMRNARPGIRPQ